MLQLTTPFTAPVFPLSRGERGRKEEQTKDHPLAHLSHIPLAKRLSTAHWRRIPVRHHRLQSATVAWDSILRRILTQGVRRWFLFQGAARI